MAGAQTAATRVASGTLQANTVDLVHLSAGGFGVQVYNDNATAPIWFTVSHPGGDCSLPTIAGVDTFCAASVSGTSVKVRHTAQYGSIVQLISSGTPSYTVAVLGNQDM
jgi:hypothetical protein